MSDKIFVGSGKERRFESGGSSIAVTLEIDGLESFYKAYGFITKSGKRCIRLKVNTRREVGKYGETHTLEIDQWIGDNGRNGQSVPENRQDAGKGGSRASGEGLHGDQMDSIPF